MRPSVNRILAPTGPIVLCPAEAYELDRPQRYRLAELSEEPGILKPGDVIL